MAIGLVLILSHTPNSPNNGVDYVLIRKLLLGKHQSHVDKMIQVHLLLNSFLLFILAFFSSGYQFYNATYLVIVF